MKLNIELTSFLAKNMPNGNIESAGGTVAEVLIAYGIDIAEVGFVTANDVLCSKESNVMDGATYKVYPTIVAG